MSEANNDKAVDVCDPPSAKNYLDDTADARRGNIDSGQGMLNRT